MSFTFAGRYGPQPFLTSSATLLPNDSVTVYLLGTTTKATLYTDRTKGTTAANPFTTDKYGNGSFWADPGDYTLSLNGVTVDVQVPIDPGEPSTADVASFNGRHGAVSPASGDYTAAQVTNVPAGGISATTVQAAANALDVRLSTAEALTSLWNNTSKRLDIPAGAAGLRGTSQGSYVNAPWNIGIRNIGTGEHDHVMSHAYNAVWDDTGQAWSRVVSGEHAVSVAYESRFTTGNPGAVRGGFEFNIDIDPALTGTPSFTRRPWFFTYSMDAPYKTQLYFGDTQDTGSDFWSMGFAGSYANVFHSGRQLPFVFGSDTAGATNTADPTKTNRIVLSTVGVVSTDRGAQIHTAQGSGQGLGFDPGKTTGDVVGELHFGEQRPCNSIFWGAMAVGGVTPSGTTGDLTIARSATRGVMYFGTAGTHNIDFNASQFIFSDPINVTGTVTGQSQFVLRGSAQPVWLSVGRTSEEMLNGVANSAGQFFTGAAAGDSIVRAVNSLLLGGGSGNPTIAVDATSLGFFSSTKATKQTVTGSRGGNAAVASLLTALAAYGLVTDSSSA